VRRWKRIALAVAMVGALLISWSNSDVADARPLLTGVSDVDSSDPIAFERVKAAGSSYVHISLSWREVAPDQLPSNWDASDPADTHYDWTPVDQQVEGAVAAGLTPVVLIADGPSWAQRCDAPPYAYTRVCDPDPTALAAFATAAARRYGGGYKGLPRVRYWQGMNEPNLDVFFSPQFRHGKPVSPDIYRKLINVFYDAIKAVDPSNLVMAAGLGPIAVPHLTLGPMRFARQLLCMKGRRDPRPTRGSCEGGVRFDIFDVHPYTTGGPMHEGGIDDVELGDLDKLTQLIDAADRAGRIKGKFKRTPVWITEFSWDSKPPDPGGLPMRILTRWTSIAMYQAWKAGITHFFWYSLRDFPAVDGKYDETVQSGLYLRGGTIEQDRPKKVLEAFRFPFVAFAEGGGLAFWGRTPYSDSGRVAIEVKEHSGWRAIGSGRATGSGVFHGTIAGNFERKRRGFVRARFKGQGSLPFSLREVKDFPQPPFG
jgi:hypothetical protein